jgi:hypothetical protein
MLKKDKCLIKILSIIIAKLVNLETFRRLQQRFIERLEIKISMNHGEVLSLGKCLVKECLITMAK